MKSFLSILPGLLLLGSASVHAQQLSGEAGKISHDIWNEISGASIQSLLDSPKFPQAPDSRGILTSLQTPVNVGSNFGQRLRGYIIPPVDGEYRFWVSGDDSAVLRLSSGPSSLESEIVASCNHPAAPGDWGLETGQASEPVMLKAGLKYYIEALNVEASEVDHLSVAWSYAGTDSQSNTLVNWARNAAAIATQSSTAYSGDAKRAIDGNTDGKWSGDSITHTNGYLGNWWQVDLGTERVIDRVELYNRILDGASYAKRLSNYRVSVLNTAGTTVASKDFHTDGTYTQAVEYWEAGNVIGRTIRVESLGKNAAGDGFLTLAEVKVWGRSNPSIPYQAIQVVPGSVLESYAGNPDDLNDNGYLDSWENHYGFDALATKPDLDVDGDFISNFEEYKLGTDPYTPSGKPANWLRERWYGTTGYDVSDLVTQPAFYQAPDFIGLTTGSVAPQGTYSGTRIRSVLTAPDTGDYTFWVSGTGATELWLSTDASKYAKQRIAIMGASAGTAHGVDSTKAYIWDAYASQMSAPIHLIAGQQYFIEILGQNGHVAGDISLAWARPGKERERFDTAFISSYAMESADADDDSLPDAWESQYGLNPLDNGFADMKKQGERGDFDSDGLSNREEYLLGTNPANADTDGDGISDYEETRQYGRNPLVSDFIPAQMLTPVDLIGALVDQGKWEISGGRLVSSDYRNHVKWTLNVPVDGIYQVEMAMNLTVARVQQAITSIQTSVDGIAVGRYEVRFGIDNKAHVVIDLPFLKEGAHQLSVDLEGFKAIGSLSLDSLQLTKPGGLDTDGDGTADTHLAKLKQRSHLSEMPNSSVLSPYVLEGISPSLGALTVSANGTPISPQPGVGTNGWKAEVKLEDAPANVVIGFERGGFQEQRTLTWVPLDLSQPHNLHARVGDSLKLSIPTSLAGRVELTPPFGASKNLTLTSQTGTYQFAAAGDFKIRWYDSSGMRSESLVHVYPTTFSADVGSVLDGRVREISITSDTRELTADGGAAMQIVKRQPLSKGEKFTVAINESGAINLGFRDAESGRLVGLLPINAIEITDALASMDYESFDSGAPDTFGVVYRMAFSDLPAGWTVDVSIFKGGVTFRDGTISHIFNSADLKNGILSLEFLHTAQLSGGLCHRYTIRDAKGRVVR